MDGYKISQLAAADAATLPTLIEVSVPDSNSASGYTSKKLTLTQLVAMLKDSTGGALAEQAKTLFSAGSISPTDWSSARTFNTNYVNTLGRPMLLLLTISMGNTWVSCRYNGADACVLNYQGQSLSGQIQLPACMVIRPGDMYAVYSGDSTLSKIVHWWEG